MVELSCAFPPGSSTPDHIATAERLGYSRAWCYDAPAASADVWMVLARAADRTDRIGLGPAVLVPSARHVMVNAAAAASLEAIAPGRVAVAVGTGSTGRSLVGERPMRWTEVEAYVVALRALLSGEDIEWGGAVCRMIHPDGQVARRPIQVPILVAAEGPKGLAAAQRVGDGVFSVTGPKAGFAWSALLQFGTVLDAGEAFDSPRVLDAAGHAAVAAYHGIYEFAADALDGLPGGPAWRSANDELPDRTRHLDLHEGHMVHLSARDRPRVTGDMIETWTFTGTAEDLAARLADAAAAGATEVVIQPGGPDIARELAAFASVAGLAH